MIKISLFIILITTSLSTAYSDNNQYGGFTTANKEAKRIQSEKQYWLNEGRKIVKKIDKLVDKRHQLDKKQLIEVLAFIKDTQKQLNNEKKYQLLAQKHCTQTGLPQDCTIVAIHKSNINILQNRLKILHIRKQGILRKKKPVLPPKK